VPRDHTGGCGVAELSQPVELDESAQLSEPSLPPPIDAARTVPVAGEPETGAGAGARATIFSASRSAAVSTRRTTLVAPARS